MARSRRHRWLWVLTAVLAALVLAPAAFGLLVAGGALVIGAVVTVLVLAGVGVALAAVAVALFGATLAAPFLLSKWLLQALFARRFGAQHGHAHRHGRAANAPAADDSAVLRRRYVAGEISEQEFRIGLVDLLKEQYVRGELDTWEFEQRLERVLRDPYADLLSPRAERPDDPGRMRARPARPLA